MVFIAGILFLVSVCSVSAQVEVDTSDDSWVSISTEESTTCTPAQHLESVSEAITVDQDEWKPDVFYEAKWKALFPKMYPIFLKTVKELPADNRRNIRLLLDYFNKEINWDMMGHIFKAIDGLLSPSGVSTSITEGLPDAHLIEKREATDNVDFDVETDSTTTDGLHSTSTEDQEFFKAIAEQVSELSKTLPNEDSYSTTEGLSTVYDTSPTDVYSSTENSFEEESGTTEYVYQTTDWSKVKWVPNAFYEAKWKRYFPEIYPRYILSSLQKMDGYNVKTTRLLVDILNRNIDWDFVEKIYQDYLTLKALSSSSTTEGFVTDYSTVPTETMEEVYQTTMANAALNTMVPEVTSGSELDLDNVVRRSGLVKHLKTRTEETSPSHEGTLVDESCEGCPLQVGSIRGIPGVHFPNYSEIPITSFSCADKHVPGFYADLETGCQVFHVCWSHRRESFLCPIGTTFNQAVLACDYWYSTNCSLAPLFFDIDRFTPGGEVTTSQPKIPASSESPITDEDWINVAKFLPVKAKVTVYYKPAESTKSVPKTASHAIAKDKHVVAQAEKSDLSPVVKEFLGLTETVLKDAKLFLAKKKLGVKPAAKLEPCKVKGIKVEPTVSTRPPVVRKPLPLPKVDPRFIVKPVSLKKPVGKVHQKTKVVAPKVLLKKGKPMILNKIKSALKQTEDRSTEVLMEALEMAGSVFQREILPMTRKALIESYAKFSKSKH